MHLEYFWKKKKHKSSSNLTFIKTVVQNRDYINYNTLL